MSEPHLDSVGAPTGSARSPSVGVHLEVFGAPVSKPTWKCFETQCRSTLSTRMVAAVETMLSWRLQLWRLSATVQGLWLGAGWSRGLEEPAVAMANAEAAELLLLLNNRYGGSASGAVKVLRDSSVQLSEKRVM